MPASDGGDDFVRIGGPFEGFGMGVVMVEEPIDGGLQIGHRSEDAAFESSLRQGGEEALDGVEPGCRGRREVKGPTWIADQPLSHGGVLVGGVVVEDRVDGLSGGDLALDGVQEADELLMPMTLHIAADHRSVEDVHGREQGRRTVPLVVVGHGSGAAFFHRQAGLGSIERLDLALLIDRQNDGVRRRIDVEPDDVAQLVDELGVPGELELPDAMRLEPMSAPDALHRADADAGRLRHGCPRPMRGLARRRFKRQGDDPVSDRRIELGDA
jgi:hypothetical protein